MGFKIKQSDVFVIILFLFNIFNYLVLSFRTIGLGELEGYIFPFILSVFFIISMKLYTFSKSEFMFIFLTLIYLSFQLFNGLLKDFEFYKSLPSFTSALFSVLILLIALKTDTESMYKTFKKVTFYSVIAMISLDLLNQVVNRNSLIIVLQNDAPLIMFALIVIIFSKVSLKDVKRAKILLVSFLLWMPISYELSNISGRLQFKSIIFLVSIIIFLIILKITLPIIPNIKKITTVKRLSFLTVTITLLLGFYILPIVWDFILNSIPRMGSGYVRFAVAQKMFEDISSTYFSFFFGQGLGSSNQHFYIANYLSNIVSDDWHNAKSHSGLMSLFYENGIIVFLFLVGVLIKILKSKEIEYNYNFKNIYYRKKLLLFLFLFIVILWIMQNMIYAVGVPGTYPFHQAQLSLYLLVVIYISKIMFMELRRSNS